jgi:endonuclease I
MKSAVMQPDSGSTWCETYAIKITAAQRKLFVQWANSDAVDEWERLRDKRIAAPQETRTCTSNEAQPMLP